MNYPDTQERLREAIEIIEKSLTTAVGTADYARQAKDWIRKLTRYCLHVSAGGTFRYYGEGPGATRRCIFCGMEEVCFNPDPSIPHYIQWRLPT